MLRVESNTKLEGFTEFEEDILFDEDDPDFKQTVPSLPIMFTMRRSNTMSIASCHPARHSPLTALSRSFDDVSEELSEDCYLQPEHHVLTIEELRLELTSCFTCGVSWADHHVSLDCSECGGYALERPCPECDDSKCGAMWKRDLTMSHSCGKARWQGECRYKQQRQQMCQKQDSSPEELCEELDKLKSS